MGKGKILLVEDRRDLARLVQKRLERDGYRVFSARDAESGLPLARRCRPDLVLLDVVLPGMDGLGFCRAFRKESDVPIIFLTAKNDELDRVLGLKLGADDYVAKPFSLEELTARIEAVLRRFARRPDPADRGPVRIGRLEIDVERHEVRVGRRPADLSTKEFAMLKALVEADGKVLSRSFLLRTVWNHSDPENLETRAVDELVSRLRRKLGPERRRIVTVTNFGYKMSLN